MWTEKCAWCVQNIPSEGPIVIYLGNFFCSDAHADMYAIAHPDIFTAFFPESTVPTWEYSWDSKTGLPFTKKQRASQK